MSFEHSLERLQMRPISTQDARLNRIENQVPMETVDLVDEVWSRRPAHVFDSDVVFLHFDASIAVASVGPYRYFFACSEISRCGFMTGRTPLAVGAHVLLRVNGGWCALFATEANRFTIPGGIMDASDLNNITFDPRVAAARELTEETGLIRDPSELYGEALWYDKTRPHYFFTYATDVGVADIERIIEQNSAKWREFNSVGLFLDKHVREKHGLLTKASWASLQSSVQIPPGGTTNLQAI